jgi:hypothetical protein
MTKTGTDGPTTADEFMALPIGDLSDRNIMAYFMESNLVLHCIGPDGRLWKLRRLRNGQWQRVLAS